MDVNGTKFHLLHGRADWGQCVLEGGADSLQALWDQPDEQRKPPLEWKTGSLRLQQVTPLFRQAVRMPPLDPNLRRGAARDQYGHFYWINAEEDGIRFLANGARTSVLFWSSQEAGAVCGAGDQFGACPPPQPPRLLLRGVAVTRRHYLVVGNVTQHGILIFDLHRGGPPQLLQWPAAADFTPWDMAATPDGGVLILDAKHCRYWRLDENFRLLGDEAEGGEALFQPSEAGALRNKAPATVTPAGCSLAEALGVDEGALHIVSIEPGPDGHVLVLDHDPTPVEPVPGSDKRIDRPSTVYELNGTTLVHAYSLRDAIRVADPAAPEGEVTLFSVRAHDFVYREQWVPDEESDLANAQKLLRLLLVAERDGNQVIAFEMDRAPLDLVARPDFLPLRRFVGKALMGFEDKAYYDFQDRFVPLQALMECHYAAEAVITTPADFEVDAADENEDVQPGQPFDSSIPGCTWHRLLLDADLPSGTAVAVRARAADDPSLLPVSAWQKQPTLYQRSDGAELPFYVEPALREGPASAGTWELLLQNVVGRYVQLELAISGTGRTTPVLYALRIWYPRFSYPDHYLPALYREEPVPASFLERWLANFEGFYTKLEGQIEQMPRLLDPRTAPVEALDWLACWFGLVLEPQWEEARRRFFIRHAFQLYGMRGTVPGLEIALRLSVEQEFGDWFFDPQCWGQSKVRIVEQFDNDENAHRFSVLLPHDLGGDGEAMVERIIELEKPAHTAFELKRYWDLFRVGEARLGIDTQLGDSASITALMLGEDALGVHYLAATYPYDLQERIVLERDRLGDLPQL